MTVADQFSCNEDTDGDTPEQEVAELENEASTLQSDLAAEMRRIQQVYAVLIHAYESRWPLLEVSDIDEVLPNAQL
jgi:hypothetical protein